MQWVAIIQKNSIISAHSFLFLSMYSFVWDRRRWRLNIHNELFKVYYLLLVVFYSIFLCITFCLLFFVYYLLSIIYYCLFIILCFLFVVYYMLFTIYYLKDSAVIWCQFNTKISLYPWSRIFTQKTEKFQSIKYYSRNMELQFIWWFFLTTETWQCLISFFLFFFFSLILISNIIIHHYISIYYFS